MRYKVVPTRAGLEMTGWGIWDDEVSPALQAAGLKPVLCSLDGEQALSFRYMTGAWSWLSKCEEAGLDLEAGPVQMEVYTDDDRGGVLLTRESSKSTGPAVRVYPLA
jgi:hypothetical protein